MKVVKTYVSVDNVEFKTEEECLAHEATLAARFKTVQEAVVLYTSEGFPLSYDDQDSFMLAYNNAAYVLVKYDIPEESISFIKEMGYGAFPPTRGLYYYTDYDWSDIAGLITPVREIMKDYALI